MSTIHLYPDGSALERPYSAGGGVALNHNDTWKFLAFSFDNTTDSGLAECKAILKALQSAVSITTSPRHNVRTVLLYTDSQAALILLNQRQESEQVRRCALRDEVADGCFAAMIILDARQVTFEAVWVKAHAGIEGNEYADVLARYGAEHGRMGNGDWNAKFELAWEDMEDFWLGGQRVMVNENRRMWQARQREFTRVNQQLSGRMRGTEQRGRELEGRWDAMTVRMDETTVQREEMTVQREEMTVQREETAEEELERWIRYT